MLIRRGEGETVHRAWVAACGLVGGGAPGGEELGVVTGIDTAGALVLETPTGRGA